MVRPKIKGVSFVRTDVKGEFAIMVFVKKRTRIDVHT